jgi:hypothetical protein
MTQTILIIAARSVIGKETGKLFHTKEWIVFFNHAKSLKRQAS